MVFKQEDITSARYFNKIDSTEHAGVHVVAKGVTHTVPLDPGNTDYQVVLAWESDGNEIEE